MKEIFGMVADTSEQMRDGSLFPRKRFRLKVSRTSLFCKSRKNIPNLSPVDLDIDSKYRTNSPPKPYFAVNCRKKRLKTINLNK